MSIIVVSVILVSLLYPIIEASVFNLFEVTEFTVQENILYMNGEINTQTSNQLKTIITSNHQIQVIVMLDVPGSIDDEANFPMASWVREHGLNTHLLSDSHIASGGVDFFLAGNSRTMDNGAMIGVHSWSDGINQAKDIPRDDKSHEMNRKYIQDMLGDDEFYWYTIYAASADDVYYMTNDEILQFGLLTEPILEK
ncbi:MAG: alpha/beta hydrolase [Nitrosopumilus sp.]|nr:hypothetical protein [Nitrosopumilus sp.]NRA05804.1 alpha/beta hydrolase [Nitrosopumilus sp.]